MSKKLIIVESPSKSKTIEGYLKGEAVVLSSKGHVRDLATTGKDGLGLDIDNNFQPNYKIIPGKQKVIKDLIAQSKNREVLIATDPDREGEAIGWHLAELLKLDLKANNRITFQEITKEAVTEALKHPRPIDQALVNSQEARRILDRIIGFKLSKLLQSKIKSKSAGRVQSVALKLIVDLEKEIEAFEPVTYYELEAHFTKCKAPYQNPKKERLTKEEAEAIQKASVNPFVVTDIDIKDSIRQSRPSFITSTLQQDAVSNLNMSSSRVMMVAQSLYEGIEIGSERVGLITYMRTDSTRLSNQFIHDAHAHIQSTYGKAYVGKYKTSSTKNQQDAHEAIRPTSIHRTPESIEKHLTKDEFKVYKRIYDRTLASLMSPAIFEVTKVTLTTNGHRYLLEGSREVFKGHLAVYDDQKSKDKLLPTFEIGQTLEAKEVVIEEKVTTPPTRYSEATLIKDLESLGIGRPSTYAQIIKTLKSRDYVTMEKKRFVPTKQGILTTEQLDLFFQRIINTEYTSKMESKLDEIADGKESGVDLVGNFYNNFIPMVEVANKNMVKIGPKMTDEVCPKCGKPLVVRFSKYGEFLACSGFPKCKYIKKDQKNT